MPTLLTFYQGFARDKFGEIMIVSSFFQDEFPPSRPFKQVSFDIVKESGWASSEILDNWDAIWQNDSGGAAFSVQSTFVDIVRSKRGKMNQQLLKYARTRLGHPKSMLANRAQPRYP